MRVIVFKLFIWLHVAMTVNSIGDQNANIESKNAYIQSELKLRGSKSHQNRYASVLMANSRNSKSSSSTTQRSPWLHQPSSSKYSYNNLNSVHLRHARYPTLTSVWTRLNDIQTRHAVATTTSTTTTTPSPKYEYQKYYRLSDNLLTANYGSDELDSNDVDNDDNLPDYDSWDSGKDEDEEDDEEDDDDFFREENGWQAEEATTIAPLGRLQNEPSSSNLELNAAIDHMQRMNIGSRCRDPLPRVLSVQNIHPSPEKRYSPHCTVLHRCSADTGCCKNHSMTCAPKNHSIVYLYFFTTMMNQPWPKVEKLPFINHTECACLDKSDEPPNLEATRTETSRDGRSYRSNISVRAADSSLYSPETIRRCKCPKEFNSMLDRDNNCSCDCDDDNEDCVRFKKGKEHFSLSDRRCIMDGECGMPKCEYGPYMRTKGRCTDKNEKLDAFASVSSNF